MQDKARMGALSKLMGLLDAEDAKGMRPKPEGDAGSSNPLEKSGMEGAVEPAKYFAKGGEVGEGDHDETDGDMFASAWEEQTGKKFKGRDRMGLGGESAMDGSGVDAASEGDDEMSEEDKATLTAAYHKHVLGKR